MGDMKVADIYVQRTINMKQSDSVQSAAEKMAQKNIGAVFITKDDGNVIGIFTERDLLTKVVGRKLDPLKVTVGEVMTKDLVCVQLDDSLSELPPIMLKGGFRHLAVANQFNIVGIISMRDVFRHYFENVKS